ncbi:MAG: hypothetical protein WD534_01490 [Phycisphaeraceae bacterium]
MAKPDEQLVQRIADQVLAAIQAESASADGRTTPAALRPPVGVCTGDYSKFTELQQSPRSPQTESGGVNPPAPAPLAGFVTAHQLEAAIKAAPDGVATLAADARLTPLAADYARQHPDKLRRAGTPSQTTRNHPAPAAAIPWLWWADGHCPAVQSLTREHRACLRPSAAPRNDVGMVEVVRDLAGLVEAKRVQGGLLFVRSGARAVCYANRCKTLRALVGTCAETVDEGVAELGANVLVIEYPYISPATMRELLARMLAQPPKLPANVAHHLADLHCR